MCSNQDMSQKPNERIRLYSWARRVASLVMRWEMSFHSQSFILLSFLRGLLQIGATRTYSLSKSAELSWWLDVPGLF